MLTETLPVAPLNPLVVPPHLRPFITPTVRRVYIDSPEDGEPSSLPPSVSEELAKLHAENQTLRSHCVLWRRRAELHGAATLGLLDFARMVRDQAVTLARERDELRRQCQSLKRKLDDQDLPSECVPMIFIFRNSFLITSSRPMCTLPRPEPSQHSSSFDFSYPSRSEHHATASPSTSQSSYTPPTLEASRFAVAALFDLHSYMNQPNTSTPNSNLGLCPPAENAPGPSTSSTMVLSTDSVLGRVPAQSNLDQPPKKRARRDTPVETQCAQVGTSTGRYGRDGPPNTSGTHAALPSSSRSGFS